MLFNSFEFLLFFPIVVFSYFLLPGTYRKWLLLLASAYFYMAFVPAYILILAFLICVDYVAGIAIERTHSSRKKFILLASIFSNIGILFFFKYFNFFNENVAVFADWINWNYSIEFLQIALPVGLSFHTFQSLSYIIEVYRGNYKAERSLPVYALYVMFFPQLVAGPIERPQHLLPQLKAFHYPDPIRITEGLRLMLWGFFKKMVIADNLAPIVATAYANPSEFSGISLIVATIAFVFQIYCDFSGYSNIAIGSAKVIGIDLSPNFNKPFNARSIADFWRRWHISLTDWFHDYVFTPLYTKVSRVKLLAKLNFKIRHFIFFSIATIIGLSILGLWHGANWTFVLFGFSQAIGILIYYAVRKYWNKLYTPIQIFLTFSIFFIGSIFFRSADVKTAFLILKNLGKEVVSTVASFPDLTLLKSSLSSIGFSLSSLMFISIAIIFMIASETLGVEDPKSGIFSKISKPARYAFYYLILLAILFGAHLGREPFIYFQF